MSTIRILARNIFSNWCGFAVQAVVTFFLTPFVLNSLGDTRYGIWALVTGLTGYYGLLDLGFRSGVTQYMTRHLATRDFEQLNRVASTAFVALAACGGLVALAAMVLSLIAPHVFSIPADAVAETRWCILIIGASTAIEFAFFPFSAVFAATQRYDMANVIGIATRLAIAGATVVALRHGYGLVGLSAVAAAGDLLGYVAQWRLACRILPELRIAPRTAAVQHLWGVTTFAIWATLIQGASKIRSSASSVIIGLFMPLAALSPYSLAVGLAGYFDQMIGPIGTVFFPAATRLDALGDTGGLRRMYLTGSRLLMLLAISGSLIASTWAEDFFRLWVGQRFVAGGEYTSVAVLFRILIAASVITAGQRIGSQVLFGARRLRSLGLIVVFESLSNLALTAAVARPFGLTGVALSALATVFVFQGIVYPVVLCRMLGITARTYLRDVYLRPCVTGGVLWAFLYLSSTLAPPATTWTILLLYGAVAGSVSLLLILLIGLDSQEQKLFVFRPLGRIWPFAARECVPTLPSDPP